MKFCDVGNRIVPRTSNAIAKKSIMYNCMLLLNHCLKITPPLLTLSYREDYLCFDVEVTSNQLLYTHYSPYQSFLHNMIKKLKAEGMGYRKIAKRLNEEDIKTSRGNIFFPSSVYSKKEEN